MASMLARLSLSTTAGSAPTAVAVERARRAAAVLVQRNTEDGATCTGVTEKALSQAVRDVQGALGQLHEVLFASPLESSVTAVGAGIETGCEVAADVLLPLHSNPAGPDDALLPLPLSLPLPLPNTDLSTPSAPPTMTAPSCSTTATTVRLMIQPDVNLPLLLLLSLPHLGFEYRKLVVTIFKHCFKNDEVFRDHCLDNLPLLDLLFECYTPAQRDICVNCHNMLEACVRYDARVVDRLLRSPRFLAAFFEDYVLSADFEVQSKALALLSCALKQHPKTTAKFLKEPENGATFFAHCNAVLSSGNYVCLVQLLSLLSDLLVVRKNRKVMVAYVSEKANLMVIMKLLRHKSASIAYEAFHVFKIFVANPAKPERVQYVFTQNSKKLIKFMKKFQKERDTDEPEFAEAKTRVIDSLKEMVAEVETAEQAKGGVVSGH